jgi:enterochelin esterase-like enzyme
VVLPTPDPAHNDPILSGGDLRASPYVGELQGSAYQRSFYSAALDREMPYYIYLPPDYGTAGRRYPVLYMLHGWYGKNDEWLAYGLFDIADQQIHAGAFPPLIIVLPQGDNGYFVNNAGDGPRWGDYMGRDIVRHVDNSYRTLRSPSARAIGGLSMGAWGALFQAFSHLNEFGVVGAHSPSLHPDDGTLAFLGTGEEFKAKDPLHLAAILPGLERLHIWLDVGDDDPFVDQASELHQILLDRGIEHDFHIFVGQHASEYWQEHVLDYIRFYGHALAPQ